VNELIVSCWRFDSGDSGRQVTTSLPHEWSWCFKIVGTIFDTWVNLCVCVISVLCVWQYQLLARSFILVFFFSKTLAIKSVITAVSWREQDEALFIVFCYRQPGKWRNAAICLLPQDGIFPIHSTAPRWVLCYFIYSVHAHLWNIDAMVDLLFVGKILCNRHSTATGWTIWTSDSGSVKIVFNSQRRPDWLRCPSNLLFIGYWSSFPG
jgi:hypothetical protein